jgi:NADH-quinone oxidoreductase subunit G
MAVETIPLCLGALLDNIADGDTVDGRERDVVDVPDTLPGVEMIAAVAADLKASRQPVIVCGTDVATEPAIRLAADAVRQLASGKSHPGLFYLMPGANGFGAAMITDDRFGFDQIIEGIEAGGLKALVLVENDPFWHYPDRRRLERAIERLDLLVVLDYLDSPAARAADIFIPTTTLYEANGLFINQEGRIQLASPAFRGGQPLEQTGNGGHPPRSFRKDIPGGEALPAWQVMAGFSGNPADSKDRPLQERLRTWLSDAHPAFADLPAPNDFPTGGVRVTAGKKNRTASLVEESSAPKTSAEDLSLLTVDWTFGTEELCRYSPCLNEREEDPYLLVQSEDAAMMTLADGDTAVIEMDGGSIRLAVRVTDKMAVGTAVLPRHRRIDWQVLGQTALRLERGRVHKVSGEES